MEATIGERTEEVRQLQRCLNDLIGVLTLPALWSGRETSRIVATLLDGLVGTLNLDFAYVRLRDSIDGSPRETLRLSDRRSAIEHLSAASQALECWLPRDGATVSHTIPNPFGAGNVTITPLRLGLRDEIGVIVAGSRRVDFPSQTELLVLRVATNQAAIGLQEARRASEQQQAARELEQRVVDRTAQLAAVNIDLTREIAERNRTEEERRKLASLIENSSDFVAMFSLEGRALFINPAGRQMVGLDADPSWSERRIPEFLVDEDRDRAQAILDAAAMEGRWSGEIRFRHFRTGIAIPMLQHAFHISDRSDTRTVALAIIGRDITERKREEAELLAVKDALATELLAMTRLHQFSTRLMTTTELEPLLEQALLATISLQNADKGCVQIYDPTTDTLELVAQRGFSDSWVEEFRSDNDIASACGRALHRRERVIIEDVQLDPAFEPHRQAAATAGFRAVQATPLFNRGGEPVGMLCTHFIAPHTPSEHELRLTDLYVRQVAVMIERWLVETALRRSEAYLSEAQRLSHTGSWAWNPSNGDCFWSNELFRIIGFDANQVAPTCQLFLERLHPEDRPTFEQAVYRAVHEQRAFAVDHRVVLPDGSIRHLHNLGHPVPSKTEGHVELIGTVMDVTERKQAQDALRRAQDALTHATRVTMLGELTASISHELNQPLAAMAANATAGERYLRADPPNVEEMRAVLRDISRDAHRASNIISQTQALFKKRETQRSPLQIADVIADVTGLMHSEALASGVTLDAEMENELPSVIADRVQLQQVIMNLVINGIQSMAAIDQGPRALVVKAGRYDSTAVLVSVRDSGIGLEPDGRDKAFNAFYTTKDHGMGMGLVISRRIIEAHGGRLWATPNDDGPGETFHFTLPTSLASRFPTSPVIAAPSRGAATPPV